MEYEHIGAISGHMRRGDCRRPRAILAAFFARYRLPDASAQCGRIFHRAEQLSRWQCLVWCGVPRVSYSHGCYRPACPGVVVRGGAGWGILLSVRGFHIVCGDKPRSVARHQRGAGCSRRRCSRRHPPRVCDGLFRLCARLTLGRLPSSASGGRGRGKRCAKGTVCRNLTVTSYAPLWPRSGTCRRARGRFCPI